MLNKKPDNKIKSSTQPQLVIYRRHLPHWSIDGAVYFITFHTKKITFTPNEQKEVLRIIRKGKDKFFYLYAAVVMPDHVHLIVRLNENVILNKITKGIKGTSARVINKLRNTKGVVWQSESFDRIIRDENELLEKLNYMLNNPHKAGLTEDPLNYHGSYFNIDF